MEIRRAKRVNARALAWEIRKAVGINCGGYNETGTVTQTGSIRASVLDGVVVELPDATPTATILAIEALVDAHIAGALPPDFPVDPPPPPPVPDPDIAAWAAATTLDQIKAIAGRLLGIG